MKKRKVKIAFIDRDGTLIYEPQGTRQVDSLEKLRILPGVILGLKNLIKNGYKIVMLTNQDGLGKTSFPYENFEKPQKELLKILRKNGIIFEAIFVCPHFKEDNCECRKPKTGLVKNFLVENYIDYENSFVIGDRESDAKFAENLGVKSYIMATNSEFPKIIL